MFTALCCECCRRRREDVKVPQRVWCVRCLLANATPEAVCVCSQHSMPAVLCVILLQRMGNEIHFVVSHDTCAVAGSTARPSAGLLTSHYTPNHTDPPLLHIFLAVFIGLFLGGFSFFFFGVKGENAHEKITRFVEYREGSVGWGDCCGGVFVVHCCVTAVWGSEREHGWACGG